MMDLDSALAQPGLRIAAWDSSADSGTLTVIGVSDGGARTLARERFAAKQQAAVEELCRERGALIGSTYRTCDFVWVIGRDACMVIHRDDGIWTEALGPELVVRGHRIRLEHIRAVVSFVDAKDLGHRGVKVELAGGEQVVVAEEHDPGAEIDPAYGRMNLEVDGGWITLLGRELAGLMGVPHRDELWGTETVLESAPQRDPATLSLVDGLIAAYDHWDDPDRVAARAAREAARDARDKQILRDVYRASIGPRARTSGEMRFFASVQPCPSCGIRIDPDKLKIYGQHTAWSLMGNCKSCHAPVAYTFLTHGDPIQEARRPIGELGEGHSEIISPREFMDEIERLSPTVEPDPRRLGVKEWYASKGANDRVRICIAELAKFFTDGADSIPADRMSDEDRADQSRRPERHTRAWLQGMKARHDAVDQALTDDAHRIDQLEASAAQRRRRKRRSK